MKTYDLIIIGSGGGSKLRPVADQGKRVAIIERDALGGTCLNRGCIPSKMLIYPADLLAHFKEGKEKFGISGGDDIQTDFSFLTQRTKEIIEQDVQDIEARYQDHPSIDYYHGEARFVSGKVVKVNNEELTAEKIFIATGSRPFIPDIPGLTNTPYMTSTEALYRKEQPKSLIVIGGGYIAVELGHFYSAFGTNVTFLVRGEMIRAEDADIRKAFRENFEKHHAVLAMREITQVAYANNLFTICYADHSGESHTLTAEALLVATGVVPNSDTLALESTRIQTDARDHILVNKFLETDEPGVYAFGDVIGKYLFRHSANFEGEYLFSEHYGIQSGQPIVYPPMPHAIFSSPQVAGVGMTEDELLAVGKARGRDYVVGINQYQDSAMGMAMRPDVGMVKVLVDVQTRKILGAHIIGEKASDIIHMLIIAMTLGATVEDMLHIIYIHPALSENIRNALRKVSRELSATTNA